MGRNKFSYTDRAGQKRNKLNKALGRELSEGLQTSNKAFAGAAFPCIPTQNLRTTRARGATIHTSNNSRLHAVLFVVLSAIIIMWALGY